ncbi:MAG TPA: 4Fe-4S binding protein [Deltaproteobacteria bacterium]|nr:4Fe-4S binding protein [Deltaproteobacteria bacterium]HQI82514.1 4Fe-4S binding protein [Deltaproteobacteria bacterium]
MAKPMDQITWQELETGAVVVEVGNSTQYETGSWRSERPVVEKEKCIKCMYCWLYCPEACIHQAEEGHFEADLKYCKGCGICAAECPAKCITMISEEK